VTPRHAAAALTTRFFRVPARGAGARCPTFALSAPAALADPAATGALVATTGGALAGAARLASGSARSTGVALTGRWSLADALPSPPTATAATALPMTSARPSPTHANTVARERRGALCARVVTARLVPVSLLCALSIGAGLDSPLLLASSASRA
jgi:hypothetical protein